MAPDTAAFRLVGEHYMSDVDGLAIAWDMCGSCLLHITVCSCREPVEPSYITRMRDTDSGLVATAARSETPNGGVRSRPSRGLSITDLVDDEVIAKVKAARA